MPYYTWEQHQLSYREQGSGPLLFVLPGNTASSACHEGELQYFSDRFHVVSLDFLGTGQSDRLEVWDVDWWVHGAHQARALATHLGYDKCVAMGTSGGGVVALLMGILFPQTVRAIVADSCVDFFSEQMVREHLLPDRGRREPGQVGFWSYAHGPDWEQVVDADTTMIQRFAANGGDWFEGRLREIRCPVLLTASQQDSLLSQVGQKVAGMAAQIADSRVFLNNAGDHPLMWSRPDVFRHISDYFLDSVLGDLLRN